MASGGCGVSVVQVCRHTCPRFLLVSRGYEPVHGGLVCGDLSSLLFALSSLSLVCVHPIWLPLLLEGDGGIPHWEFVCALDFTWSLY